MSVILDRLLLVLLGLLLGLPQPAAGFPQLARAVTAPQLLKHAIVKALPTETDAIDA